MAEALVASRRVFEPGSQYRRETANSMAKMLIRQAEEAIEEKNFADARERLSELKKLASDDTFEGRVDPAELSRLEAVVRGEPADH
jgi:hypothetical protein